MRVEFYVLPSADPVARLRAACQLALKAWIAGFAVFIRGQDDAQCQSLDELLWHFKAERFVPHALHSEQADAPVVIGTQQAPSTEQGVLLNLAQDLSPHLPKFSRVIEVVNQEPQLLNACRENFRAYRQRGYDPQRVEL